jgi:hypothetical protein
MVTRPLNFGSNRSLIVVSSRPGALGVVADPDRPRLPGQRECALRVVVDRAEVVLEVARVGHVALVDRLDVAVAHPAGGHVVREHDQVAVDGLAAFELLADLPEELEVVVDVLDVLDVAARLLLVGGDDLLVDVQRPVGETPGADLRPGVVDGGGRRRLLRIGLRALHATTGGQHGREPGGGEAEASRPAQEAPAGETVGQQVLFEHALEGRIRHRAPPWRR